jgi:hypothetical protein
VTTTGEYISKSEHALAAVKASQRDNGGGTREELLAEAQVWATLAQVAATAAASRERMRDGQAGT